MAYNASNEERTELGSITKNSRGEIIKVALIKNKNTNNESIDIRNYYTDNNGDIMPTSKGVRFNTENYIEFIGVLLKGLNLNELEDLKDIIIDEINNIETSD